MQTAAVSLLSVVARLHGGIEYRITITCTHLDVRADEVTLNVMATDIM